MWGAVVHTVSQRMQCSGAYCVSVCAVQWCILCLSVCSAVVYTVSQWGSGAYCVSVSAVHTVSQCGQWCILCLSVCSAVVYTVYQCVQCSGVYCVSVCAVVHTVSQRVQRSEVSISQLRKLRNVV